MGSADFQVIWRLLCTYTTMSQHSLRPQPQVHQLQVLDDEAAQKLASQRAEAAAAQRATPSADAASSAATGGATSGAGSSAYVPVPAAKSSATTRITAFTPSIGALCFCLPSVYVGFATLNAESYTLKLIYTYSIYKPLTHNGEV